MAFICKSCNSKRGYYSGYILENMYFEKCIVLVAKMHPFFFFCKCCNCKTGNYCGYNLENMYCSRGKGMTFICKFRAMYFFIIIEDNKYGAFELKCYRKVLTTVDQG